MKTFKIGKHKITLQSPIILEDNDKHVRKLVRHHVKNGRFLEAAIKWQVHKGISLKESKEYIDKIRNELGI
ncbi:MAG: hypothetical protein ACOC22_03010 [bacterium]